MADTPNPDAAPQPEPTAELDALRAKLAATEQDLHNHKLQLAEFVTARKRLLRDVAVEKKYAVEPLARDLLAALDNLDRAAGREGGGDTGRWRSASPRRPTSSSRRWPATASRESSASRAPRSTRTATKP